jgi:hypothetical protein
MSVRSRKPLSTMSALSKTDLTRIRRPCQGLREGLDSAPGAAKEEALAFENVLWIGGPPGSGKTTVAEWLALTHGLRYWGADKFAQVHHRRMAEERLAAIREWEAMTHDERWLGDPIEMARLSLAISGRRGEMIIEDLSEEPPAQPIVVEGTPLRPSVIEHVIASPAHALWLVPSPEAEERNLRTRGGHSHTLSSDPARAETNRIAREIFVAEKIAQEATDRGMYVIRPGAEMSLTDVEAAVEGYFAPVLAKLPLARTDDERRNLRRAENLALLEHLKEFLMEAPDVGTPDTFSGRFSCECGRLGETEHVQLTLTAYDELVGTGQSLVAPLHL